MNKLAQRLLESSPTMDPTSSGLESVNPILRQAIGHFFEGWGKEDAPAILEPYRHRYTENRAFDPLPEWSEFLLDRESEITAAMGDDTNGPEFWKSLENEASGILAQYD